MTDCDTLNVWNGQRLVGCIRRDSFVHISFRYDAGWFSGEGFAIGVKSEAGEYAEDELMVFVIPKEGKDIYPPELMDYLQPRMPYFMIPRFIKSVDSFPKTGTQRTQKNKLREQGITKDT